MAGLLKGLAIAAGAGLAIGIAANVRTAPRRRSPRCSDDELLRMEPLLDRIEALESRLDTAERRTAPASLNALDRRATEQELQLRDLRATVEETERRAAMFLDRADACLRQAMEEIPAQVSARAREMASRVLAEAAAERDRDLALVERRIEAGVNARIAAIEQTVADHSVTISALRAHAEQTSIHLQKVLSAVEKLCERSIPVAPVPFQAQLNEAIDQEPEPVFAQRPQPVFAQRPQPVFAQRPEPVFAGYAEPAKKRFQIGRMLGMIATLGLWGLRR